VIIALIVDKTRQPLDVKNVGPDARPRRTPHGRGSSSQTGDTAGDALAHYEARTMRVCIVGASGKLGQYMVQHALDRGYEVVGVCREQSVGKLDKFKGRITVVPGATNDPDVIRRAIAGCDGVLVVLVPRGVHGYSTGTAQAVLDHAPPGARLVFSCGWHITRDGQLI
jgi:coenzyme F420-reducing hydrogenase delta subunit